MQRPSWDKYFIDITLLVATRSTCLRRGVGALLVKDRNILATGYNGAPRGEATLAANSGRMTKGRQRNSNMPLMRCRIETMPASGRRYVAMSVMWMFR